jgi:cytochrome P450
VFGQRVVLIDDADMIAEVLQNQQQRFARDTGAVRLREIVGDGVLTTEDPVHLQRRRLLQPAFHRARITAPSALLRPSRAIRAVPEPR